MRAIIPIRPRKHGGNGSRPGQVLLNGQPASPDEPLARGDRLSYYRLPWEEPDAPTDFGTLYEDGDVLALAKPSGLPVLPGGCSWKIPCST